MFVKLDVFRNDVKKHILGYDLDPANRPKVSCRICDKEFGNHATLRYHFIIKHTGRVDVL